MKLYGWFVILLFAIGKTPAAPFQNLDFENYDPQVQLVPGWTFQNLAAVDPRPRNSLPLDWFPLASPVATMRTFSFNNQGSYAPDFLGAGERFPWLIWQTGDIPADAKSITFDFIGAHMSLTFDNIPIALAYTEGSFMGHVNGDISAFSGKTVDLEFVVTSVGPNLMSFSTTFDNIIFSREPATPIIPEPRTLALSIIGALIAFVHWRSSRTAR